jgi:general secretion pathway protein G
MVKSAKQRFPSGFTLIELLVVLAIVSTLLLLVVPRYFQHLDAAKESVLRENLRITRDVIIKFYGDIGRYPNSLEELVERQYLRTVPIDPFTESATTWTLTAPPSGYPGSVYDIHSGVTDTKQGSRYADW